MRSSGAAAVAFNAHREPAQPRPLPPTLEFHRSLPGYAVTPLVEVPELARALGVAAFAVKDEERRLGVPSFKLLGSSWALHERIRRREGRAGREVLTLDDMRAHVAASRATLCTASDGNYGRSIAALAEMLGCASVVFLPAETAAPRIADVRAHGARVELVRGGYDETVVRARAAARSNAYWYCPDTAGFGADEDEMRFASDVAIGYATLFVELLSQLGRAPDVLFIQAGVGGLASGAILALDAHAAATRVVAVEPDVSNAVYASIAAGEPCQVDDVFTIMAGLRSQSVSAAAWPLLRSRLFAASTIRDADAAEAMRLLARHGVVAGESGAAGVAGAVSVLERSDARDALGVDSSSVIATVNTEGATDPVTYGRIVSREP